MHLIIILVVFGTLYGTIKAENVKELQAKLDTLDKENAELKAEQEKLQHQVDEYDKKQKEIADLEKELDVCQPSSRADAASAQNGNATMNSVVLPKFFNKNRKKFRTAEGRRHLVNCLINLSTPSRYSCVPYMHFTGAQAITMPGEDPIYVRCDGQTAGSGWLIIQRRVYGTEDFYRPWEEYRRGFGKMLEDSFLGLENIYKLTNYQRFELFVKTVSFAGKVNWARYSDFLIGSEDESYVLKSVGEFSGTEDVLSRNVNSKFSTYDRESSPRNLSQKYHGGYWYIENGLQSSNPNGKYLKHPYHYSYGMHWATTESEKSVKMMIRPVLG
ncbi:hypothetical protein AWZ03_002142 [Drosophila navojoa]|uniref:Fibrinogen C-terminal domain-containing protein n=1 Tax=Drosophila navojoa TaxID=7232 RepID=A0A484BRD1_DRONA|nr:ficolin-2-like [Drosophila navojoa]TDG51347.1 hypothetical protein AWZ03_002142 [Drosophila navojoa]